MSIKRKIKGGLIGLIGFLLSPLSWWNDLFVNVPLAILFGWLVSFFYAPIFEGAVILGYWLTNVLGLVLLHKGAREWATKREGRDGRHELIKGLTITMIYTLIIVVLVKWKIIAPLPDYLRR
jgi:hypothetical protein